MAAKKQKKEEELSLVNSENIDVKTNIEDEEIEITEEIDDDQDDKTRLKDLQNQVIRIKYLIEHNPYPSEHKFLNKMLKVRFDEIDKLKTLKKVIGDIDLLKKKLSDLLKIKDKLLK